MGCGGSVAPLTVEMVDADVARTGVIRIA